jgi:hypothetical protein
MFFGTQMTQIPSATQIFADFVKDVRKRNELFNPVFLKSAKICVAKHLRHLRAIFLIRFQAQI